MQVKRKEFDFGNDRNVSKEVCMPVIVINSGLTITLKVV